ncbi:spore germination protein [Bacillus sp. AFS053548]|uniref:spore germination protein n=1 Tax=Bacillus sp. AFS053548 TaxID=2033505 RepID=UPI000BFD9C8B|nr:spore germination protein [Bacillus sp. AFS053548]PGM57817.1 spore germination protein [Bacillus sp. AFS053548]
MKDTTERRSSFIDQEGNLNSNIELLRTLFPTSDLEVKNVMLREKKGVIIYLNSLVNEEKIDQFATNILEYKEDIFQFFYSHTTPTKKIEDIEHSLLAGKSVILIDGEVKAFLYSVDDFPIRPFSPPSIDNSIKGSKISFVEMTQHNLGLLRRYIQSRDLLFKETKIGIENKSRVTLAYLNSVAKPDLVTEIESKLSTIKFDSILNASQLAQMMENYPLSFLPQLVTTERPDIAAEAIQKGKVVIVLDRSSEVIILPGSFISFFKSIDDSSTRPVITFFIFFLRIIALFITLYLPGIYISIVSFNYDVVPLKLIISIGESRANVPFDPLVEAIIMEITLELLREAAIRLPTPISTTVGVVGGIVIGQAAVQAGIVSNIMVIVVALTAISSFIIPNYDMASSLRILRFPIMIMASIFGIIGIIASTMIIIAHGLKLSSYNESFSQPFSPMNFKQLKKKYQNSALSILFNQHITNQKKRK